MIDFNSPQVPEFTHVACSCQTTELRQKTTRAGRIEVKHQCLTCGSTVGGALPLTALRVRPQDHPEWDHGLHDQYWKAYQKARDKHEKAKNLVFWDWYDRYLVSEQWEDRRRRVFERANYTCEACRQATATQVHHTTYQHVGDEPLWDLRAVCTPCHDRIHSYRKPWEGET